MSWLLLRGLGREQRHWHEFPERLREWVAPEPVFLIDLAGTGTERGRLPVPSVPWLARDVARRAAQLESPAAHRGQPGGAADAWSLIGLSLGGMVALELCWLWARSVRRAIVINSSSRLSSPLHRLRPGALRPLGRALLAGDALERESHVLALTSELPSASRQQYARRASSFAGDGAPTRRAFFSQLCAAARFEAPSAGSLSAELCFVGSRGDRLVSALCSRDLARLYSAPYLEHPWAGHDLPLDDPGWICQRVARIPHASLVT